MASLKKIDGWAGFDQDENLSGLIDAEKIRNRLFDAVVEKAKVFVVQATDELPARIGNDHADIDSVDANTNVGRGLDGGLLRERARHEQEHGRNKKSRTISRGEKHRLIWNRRMVTEKTEALSRAKFPEGGTGLAISAEREPTSGLGRF